MRLALALSHSAGADLIQGCYVVAFLTVETSKRMSVHYRRAKGCRSINQQCQQRAVCS